MIRLAGVRKSYRGRGEVLGGVDLELVPGRPVAVLGANGTGKSTLLRIVAGCSRPSAGRVVGRPDVVGYLPAHAPVESRMPAGVWLRHLARLHGTPRADPSPVLEALGFTADDVPLRELSTGNLRKVELAQALSCRAGLLVLDEPWTGLDQTACEALHELLGAAESALLVADHSGQAAAIAEVRLVRLVDGVLAAADPASPVTVVELRCPGDPRAVLPALPPVLDEVVTDGTLTVRVPVEHGDALLATALGLHCSVVAVHREGVA